MARIYVASSWRNAHQPTVVRVLREAGHEVYDFKGDGGFPWRSVDPDWKRWTQDQYLDGIHTAIATKGFNSDFDAMEWSEFGVLVTPCGASAHLEGGYFAGHSEKQLVIQLPQPFDDDESIAHFISRGHSLLQDRTCKACGDIDGCHLWRTSARERELHRHWEPELMYRMASAITRSPGETLDAISMLGIGA